MIFTTRRSLFKVQNRGLSTVAALQSLKPLRGMLVATTYSCLLLIGFTALITGTDHVFAKDNTKDDSKDK